MKPVEESRTRSPITTVDKKVTHFARARLLTLGEHRNYARLMAKQLTNKQKRLCWCSFY